MPHQIIEYSANLDSRMDIQALIDGMHEAALHVEGLPMGGLRTRAARRENFHVADRHPDNAFVHMILKLGHGRSTEQKKSCGETLFAALC
ncbi:MAG: 5-carboxymethyl-2-hydroxymuconate Delta-isomerase, partial [Gammaproteobacteria bacterium]|nr:5-carboxymethyl-2-hydroxymuconate Delta-isomerase [Gammaproteobacteria bacterium]